MRRLLAILAIVGLPVMACSPNCDQLAQEYASAEFSLAFHLDSLSDFDFASLDETTYRLCLVAGTKSSAQCEAERRQSERERNLRTIQRELEVLEARDAYRAACRS